MPDLNFISLYARVAIRSNAREALLMPKVFAQWGKQQMLVMPGMVNWPARQWIGAFLFSVTGTEWIVEATTLDLAAMPRHDPQKKMERLEHTTDDPLLPMQEWVVNLTRTNTNGAGVERFIADCIAPPMVYEPYTRGKTHALPTI